MIERIDTGKPVERFQGSGKREIADHLEALVKGVSSAGI